MTTTLQTAIHLAQTLSHAEQVELLNVLTKLVQQPNSSQSLDLEVQSHLFWKSSTIEDLLKKHNPPVVSDVQTLSLKAWKEDDSVNEFLTFLSRQRATDSAHE